MNKFIIICCFMLSISLIGCSKSIDTDETRQQVSPNEIVEKIIIKDEEYMNFIQEVDNYLQNGINNELDYTTLNTKVELLDIEYNKLEKFFDGLETSGDYSPEVNEALEEYKKASLRLDNLNKRRLEDYRDYYRFLYDDDFYKSLGFYQFEWEQNKDKYSEEEFLDLNRKQFISNNNIVKTIAEREGDIDHLVIRKENARKIIMNN